MQSTNQIVQGFVLAVATYFAVRFGCDAFASFALLYDGTLDYGAVVTPIARFLTLGAYGRLVLCGAIAFLNYAAAILLLAHIVSHLFARDEKTIDSDVFGSAFLLVVFNIAVAMSAAILAMDAGAMRLASIEMVATAAAAILSDLDHRWRLARAREDLAYASRPYFPRDKSLPEADATVHWLDFGQGKTRVEM